MRQPDHYLKDGGWLEIRLLVSKLFWLVWVSTNGEDDRA